MLSLFNDVTASVSPNPNTHRAKKKLKRKLHKRGESMPKTKPKPRMTPRQQWNTYVLLTHSQDSLTKILHRAKTHDRETWLPDEIKKEEEIKQTVYSDTYQCPKCGQRKTTYTQVQTRSADEGMTSFITCAACKHRWRES